MIDPVRSWTFWVPEIPEGSNAQNRMRGKGSWHQVHRLRTEAASLVVPWIREIQTHPLYRGPFQEAEIEIHFHWPDRRRRDPLNYVEGVKAIVDALIGVLLVDDNADNLPVAIIRGSLGTGRSGILVTVREKEEEG